MRTTTLVLVALLLTVLFVLQTAAADHGLVECLREGIQNIGHGPTYCDG